MEREKGLQTEKNKGRVPRQNERLLRILLSSLEELEKKQGEVAKLYDQIRNKERKEVLNQVLLDVGEDHFGYGMFSAFYKKSILNRKMWANDELVSQLKCYERLSNRLTKLSIELSMILAEEKRGTDKRKGKKFEQ